MAHGGVVGELGGEAGEPGDGAVAGVVGPVDVLPQFESRRRDPRGLVGGLAVAAEDVQGVPAARRGVQFAVEEQGVLGMCGTSPTARRSRCSGPTAMSSCP
ncbi:hypothetical protein OG204_04120 [Streptomyces sp. NBC_01387]|uniref:hypothetical protein n=1 Tax=Streptomyces sp. NBC_01387 TaxID=2903849 RepID=UPI00324F6E81